MSQESFDRKLERSLERMGRALERSIEQGARKLERESAKARRRRLRRERRRRQGNPGGMFVSAAILYAISMTMGIKELVPVALLMVALGVIFSIKRAVTPEPPASEDEDEREGQERRAHVGMGATVAADAQLEPGARIEMGSTVGSGAVIRRGAVVRMGSTVSDRAVIEADAVVSWGATVHEDARVGMRSVVGAGATVGRGAQVPNDTTISPGTSWSTTTPVRTAAPSVRAPVRPVDARRSRLEAACDRLASELGKASKQVREHLDPKGQTASMLRNSCRALMDREATLRSELSSETEAKLEQERAGLQARINAETDDQVRRSLSGAVGAIDEQKRQRDLLRRSADRMDAEVTRLILTVEGMGAQLLRLNNAGLEAGQPAQAELASSVQQLQGEIDAITEALEEVSQDDRARYGAVFQPVSLVDGEGSSPGDRSKVR